MYAAMLARLFRPRQKPRSTREMIRVLRAAAQFSDDTAQRIEYDQAADALDRVLTAAERHSDAPTRDAFSYALGRAELDLGDKLGELIEINKEDHILIQGLHAAQVEQGAAASQLWAAFQSFAESLTQWREQIEHWRGQVDATLASFRESRDRSIEERHLLRDDMDESKAHRARLQSGQEAMQRQLIDLAEAVQRIEQLLEPAGTHEAGS